MPRIESTEDYLDEIEEIVDIVEDESHGDLEADRLHEVTWEEADYFVDQLDVWDAIAVLLHSPTRPQEWEHYVSDGDPWQRVIKALVFDVVRTDLHEELRDRDLI